MLNKSGTIPIKWAQGMVEYLIVFPIFLLIAVYFISTPLLWMWIGSFPILFLLGLVFRRFTLDKKRWTYLLYTLVIAAMLSLLFINTIVSIVLTFLLGCVALIRGCLYAERRWNELFSSSYLWIIAFPIYFVSYFFFRYVETLVPYSDVITWMGLLMLAFTLLISNSEHLKTATLSKQNKPFVSPALKRQNQLFIFITLLIIIALTNLKVIQAALYGLISKTIHSIIWFFSLFGSDEPMEEPPKTPNNEIAPTMEQGEPSLLAIWLDRIMTVIIYVALIAAGLFLLFYLFKKFRGLLYRGYQWLVNFLNQIFSQKEQDDLHHSYVDKKESSMDWKSWRKNKQEHAKELIASLFKRSPRFEDLTNQEKVRYVYRQLLVQQTKQGYTVKSNYTPHETISELENRLPGRGEELLQLEKEYAKARYGNEDSNNTKLEDFSSLINRQ